MKSWPLLLVLTACKDPIVPPPPNETFRVTVQSEPHDWSHYSCTVAVELASPSGRVAADSATVGAGSEAAFSLSAPPARYDAYVALRWVGRPGTTWNLDGTWYDTLSTRLPDSTLVRCP